MSVFADGRSALASLGRLAAQPVYRVTDYVWPYLTDGALRRVGPTTFVADGLTEYDRGRIEVVLAILPTLSYFSILVALPPAMVGTVTTAQVVATVFVTAVFVLGISSIGLLVEPPEVRSATGGDSNV